MLFSATAAGRSARGTMSPTEACQDGLFSAVPQPIRKVKASSSQGVMQAEHRRARVSSDRNDQHEALRDQHHLAPVETVGDRAGDQRKQHDRQRGRGLHQRDHVGRGRRSWSSSRRRRPPGSGRRNSRRGSRSRRSGRCVLEGGQSAEERIGHGQLVLHLAGHSYRAVAGHDDGRSVPAPRVKQWGRARESVPLTGVLVPTKNPAGSLRRGCIDSRAVRNET